MGDFLKKGFMKTRIVHTKIWEDEWFCSISRASQHLFLYLITCSQNNICGIFEMSDRVLMFNSTLNKAELEQAKKDLSGKVVFYSGWVKMIKAQKYNNYVTNPKLEIALNKELELIPEEIKKYFDGYDTSIDTSIYTTNNHKSKIINKNIYNNIDSLTAKDVDLIAEQYSVSVSFVSKQLETMKLWCSSKGKSYKNYYSALQNWVRRKLDEEPAKAGKYSKTSQIDEDLIKLSIERSQNELGTN